MKNRRPGDGVKVAGAGHLIRSREVHHWWPRGLSKLWVDDKGLVSQLRHTGKIERSKPKNFGAISNAHFLKFEGPWNATVEPIFAFADSNLPGLVSRICAVLAVSVERTVASRLQKVSLSAGEKDILGEGVASLIIR